jgi:hypothetical protein
MIAHQAVGQHPPPIAARHPAQDLEKPLPIPIIPKHQSPLIPTRNDMEDTTGLLDPRRTHHHPNLAPKQTTNYGCERIVTIPSHRHDVDTQVERRRPDPGSSGVTFPPPAAYNKTR